MTLLNNTDIMCMITHIKCYELVANLMSSFKDPSETPRADKIQTLKNFTYKLLESNNDDYHETMMYLRCLEREFINMGDLDFPEIIESQIDELRELDFQELKRRHL